MSIDSKLFTVVDEARTFEIVKRAIQAISHLYDIELNVAYGKSESKNMFHFRATVPEKWSRPELRSRDAESFTLNFAINGEVRSIYIFTGFSRDYIEIDHGNKVRFSIGYWGRSDDFMKAIAEHCKPISTVYYDFNDCDELDFVKL